MDATVTAASLSRSVSVSTVHARAAHPGNTSNIGTKEHHQQNSTGTTANDGGRRTG